jgi:hypothetical protein
VLAAGAALLALPALAAEPLAVFADPALGVRYEYPARWRLDPEFQGSSAMVGVTDSSPERGDSHFGIAAGEPALPRLDEGDEERFIAALRAAVEPGLPRARFQRAGPARLLGRPAVELVWHHRPLGVSPRQQVLQLVATVAGGRGYVLRCHYPLPHEAEYAAACDTLRASASLQR